MAWTYVDNDPAGSNLNAVRFHVADTNEADQLVSDGEILFALANQSDVVLLAAADCCDAIALKLGREADSKGDTEWKSDKKYEQYKTMATQLRERHQSGLATQGAMPYAGGISIADLTTRSNAADRVAPAFTRGIPSRFQPDPETIGPPE